MTIEQHRYAFIGGGNMARSLIGGLRASGVAPSSIDVSDPSAEQRASLVAQFGVQTHASNVEAADRADVIILAVKPQEMSNVARELAPGLQQRRPLIMSVAAGIRTDHLARWLGELPIVRTMPNRPALYSQGATGLFATAAVDPRHRELAAAIMGAVGTAVWVEREEQLDAVTAVSGSGPAYFFLLIEMIEQAGVDLGLSASTSRELAIATAWGAAYMAKHDTTTPAVLREQVTSKGGTTEAALRHLESQEVRAIFAAAIKAARDRSAELARMFGD
jgi:pyrroline-5-carboxylate reductase